MADQQKKRAPRRFLEDLEQRVGGIAVHVVGAVDDDDAPAAFRRGETQEVRDLARVVDDDLVAQHPLARLGIGRRIALLPLVRVDAALDGQEVGMTARGDPAEDGIVLRDGERGWRRRGEKIWPRRALGEQVAGQAKRQRRLADAARPAEDQGVGQPALPMRL
jgi:predicted pyridoxine 5'-phosphate oxidase superfamily flavin-nucleotide-binding protein